MQHLMGQRPQYKTGIPFDVGKWTRVKMLGTPELQEGRLAIPQV